MQQVQFDRTLIEKYNISGPRYTSYPTVLKFSESLALFSYPLLRKTLLLLRLQQGCDQETGNGSALY